MEQSLAMARAAVENGIEFSVVTPHINPGRHDNTWSNIFLCAKKFRSALQAEGIPLKIGMAAEVRLDPDILPLLDRDEIPFFGAIDGYQIMLLEFPHTHIPPGADKLVRKLLDRKIRPIIAHPERNKDIVRDLGKIEPYIEMGCLLQLTASAIVGRFGEGPHRRALEILELDALKVLATDAHNLSARRPELREGRDAAAKIIGDKAADALVYTNPMTIARDQIECAESFWSSADVRSVDEGSERRSENRSRNWRRSLFPIAARDRTADAGRKIALKTATNSRLEGMKAVFAISIGGTKLFKKKVRLDGGKIIIGRQYDNQVVIDGECVSRQHAMLTIADNTLQISDLNSKNGVRVNGKKIVTSKLENGDTLKIGVCDIVFSLEPSRKSDRHARS
jgi:protein-tyrosine phosphatase